MEGVKGYNGSFRSGEFEVRNICLGISSEACIAIIDCLTVTTSNSNIN